MIILFCSYLSYTKEKCLILSGLAMLCVRDCVCVLEVVLHLPNLDKNKTVTKYEQS